MTTTDETSPDNPTDFAGLKLDPRIGKALDKLGYSDMTPIQAASIPLILAGRDVIGSAETGSGKTAAFLLPIIQRLLTHQGAAAGTRALVLAPTRELVMQIVKAFKELTQFTPLKAGRIIGGEEFRYQKAMLRKDPELVVATPGRMLEQCGQGNADFSKLEVLVLDEADRMLDLGFSEDVLSIASYCHKDRQTLLFSATMQQKGLGELIKQLLNEPEKLLLNTAREQPKAIVQQVVFADDVRHKQRLLAWLLNNETFDKALVFTNTRAQADALGGLLRYQDFAVDVLHGEKSQDDRKLITSRYRQGKIKILIASDVAARGLDVSGIDLVVNFDMAHSGDDYLHRIGRTGRAGEAGLAIALISNSEYNLMSSIERYLKQRFERRVIKGQEGSYKGPKKVKASGKAAGSKKKKAPKTAAAKKKAAKPKKKNIPKTTKRPAHPDAGKETGFGPLKKKR